MTDARRLTPPPTKPHTSVVRLPDQWYVACLSTELGKRPIARTVLGIPLALFRSADGTPAALLDRCAHRNIPLSSGTVVGPHLQCAYHGWEFDTDGACRKVPGLCQPLEVGRARRVPAYPVREHDGFVWVYATPDATPARDPYRFPTLDEGDYTVVRRMVEADGTLHATLENALDVPHTAFLHGGLFRTSKRRAPITAKLSRWSDRAIVEYLDEPRPTGLVARLLSPSGGTITHFDRFFLPCIAQVEYRLGSEAHFLVTSACTPVHDFKTRLYATIHFRTRLPGALLRPLLEVFGRRIFAQDARVLSQQSAAIKRFGGEQFESTEIDLLGPVIYRLLKQAERGDAAVSDAPEHEKTIRMMA